MKILILNEDLGLPTDEPFEVIEKIPYYKIDFGDPIGVQLVSSNDVEELTKNGDEDEG